MRSLYLFLALLSFPALSSANAVLGIDLGTQFFKVGYKKTGMFDLVLNEASKRKTSTAVAFHEGERLLGDLAAGLKTKRPTNVATKFQRLIGRMFDDPQIQKNGFGDYDLPAKLSKHPERGTVMIELGGELYQPEEVMGQLLWYMKDMAEKDLERKVVECVITVPPFMTEHERRLMLDAAAMADLKVLMLMNDNTAVALKYGIESDDSVTNSHNVLFVDLGASHMTNTLVSYFNRNVSSYKQVPSMEVKAVTFDPAVGGADFDRRLTNYLADAFNKAHNKKIQEHPRAMAKLAKATEKVKQQLSANNEMMIMVESLLDDVDFKHKLTRSVFEELSADLFDAIEKPIVELFEKFGISPEDIDRVVPFGGGTRMPKFKSVVLKAAGLSEAKWKPQVNADEDSALGAVFVGANVSTTSRLKPFHVYDMFPFSVGVSIGGKEATLFKPGSAMEAKKTLTQAIDDDMKATDTLELALKYDDKSVLPTSPEFDYPMELAEFTVTGMNAALAKHNVTGNPKVTLAIGLGKDGLTDLLHADAKIQSWDMVKKKRFVRKNMTVEEFVPFNNGSNQTNGSNKTEEESETEDADGNQMENDTQNQTNDTKPPVPRGSIQNVTREKTVEVTEETLQKVTHMEPLAVKRVRKGVPPMSESETEVAIGRHKKLIAEEKARAEKADAKNDLEAWINSARRKLGEDGMETVSTEEERTEIGSQLEAGEDWLYEDGEDVETAVYKEKKSGLKDLVKEIFHRFDEIERRAEAIAKFKAVVADARERVVNWTQREEKRIEANETSWIHKNDTDRLNKLVDDAETWLQEKEGELEKAGLLVKPPCTAREIEQQIRPVQYDVELLRYRPKPRSKLKKKSKNSTAQNGTNSTVNSSRGQNSTEEEEKEVKKDEL